jgi:phage gp36-like protein
MYATAAEFKEEIGTEETVQLTNLDNPSATTVNTTRLEKTLSAATGEINSYLATRYSIPVSPIPHILKTYCIDIAWYRLAQNNAPEQFATRYNNAIARLKDIEKGQMLLVDDLGVVIAQRPTTNQLIDDRGQTLDDWTSVYAPGGDAVFTKSNLSLY